MTLADRLGTPVVEFPGDHAGFMVLPEQCAQVLDQVLTMVLARARNDALPLRS